MGITGRIGNPGRRFAVAGFGGLNAYVRGFLSIIRDVCGEDPNLAVKKKVAAATRSRK